MSERWQIGLLGNLRDREGQAVAMIVSALDLWFREKEEDEHSCEFLWRIALDSEDEVAAPLVVDPASR